MKISLGFVKFVGQMVVQELDLVTHELKNQLIDMSDLTDVNLQALIVGQPDQFQELHSLLVKEKDFYPIFEAKELKTTLLEFEAINAFGCRELYEKIQHRWLMMQNMQSVENLVGFHQHLSSLWSKERLTFLEELWYWLRRNLGTVELSLIFNDIEQINEADKTGRPKLTQAILSGGKKGHFKSASAAESEVFHQCTQNVTSHFEIVEFDSKKCRFVAVAKIQQSPIMIMGLTNNLNPLQKSLLQGLFKSLATTK
jgi:hypothetical protein